MTLLMLTPMPQQYRAWQLDRLTCFKTASMRSASGSANTIGGLIFSTFTLGPSTVMSTLSPSMASLM